MANAKRSRVASPPIYWLTPAVDADQAAWNEALRPKATKLVKNPALRDDVVEGLVKKWSPEQILDGSPSSMPTIPIAKSPNDRSTEPYFR